MIPNHDAQIRMLTPAVVAKNLVQRLPSADGSATLTILAGVELKIQAGESVAIVGKSGSGKTTLLSLLAGLDVPSSGEVLLNGTAMSGLSEDGRAQLRAGNVGFVFQSFQLLASFSALENVMLPVELAGGRDAQAKATAALQSVGLGARLGHYPPQLSGGEQQRVALARAFVNRPSILFADEPTGNLDGVTGAAVIDLLFALNKEQGATLVLITHDEQLAARCDRRLTLINGVLHD